LSAAADLYARAGERGAARNYYDRARAIYVAEKNIYPLLGVLKRIGELEVAQDPQTTSLDYYLREVESAVRARDPFSQGVALEAAATFYREKKGYQNEIAYLERALGAYHAAGLRSQEISIIRSMSNAYADMGNKARAEEFRRQADELSKLPR
jgi:tetratricopeptide (TPR) repeat protein